MENKANDRASAKVALEAGTRELVRGCSKLTAKHVGEELKACWRVTRLGPHDWLRLWLMQLNDMRPWIQEREVYWREPVSFLILNRSFRRQLRWTQNRT